MWSRWHLIWNPEFRDLWPFADIPNLDNSLKNRTKFNFQPIFTIFLGYCTSLIALWEILKQSFNKFLLLFFGGLKNGLLGVVDTEVQPSDRFDDFFTTHKEVMLSDWNSKILNIDGMVDIWCENK